MKSVTRKLSRISLLLLISVISISGAIIYIQNFIADDILMQLASARSFIGGNGIALRFPLENDLSGFYTRVIDLWPPGYALFISPILYITKDAYLSKSIVDIIAVSVFFIAWYKILLFFGRPIAHILIPVVFIFWGLSYSPFKYLSSTDWLSGSVYSVAIYFFLSILLKKNSLSQNHRMSRVFVMSVFCFLSCFFRFSYYPFTFLLPLYLLLYAILIERELVKLAFLSLFIVITLVSAQLYYQKYYTESFNYLSVRHADAEMRIFWENLKRFDTIFIKTFISPDYFGRYARIIDFVLGITVVSVALTVLYNEYKKFKDKKAYSKTILTFFSLGIGFLILNILFLTTLSLKYPPQTWESWTYVQETRYYLLSMVFCLIILVTALLHYQRLIPRLLKIAVTVLFTALCLAYLVTGVIKYLSVDNQQFNATVKNIRVLEKLVWNNKNAVVFATDDYHDYWENIPVNSLGMSGAIAGARICHIETLLHSNFNCQTPVTLLIAIIDDKKYNLEDIYSKYKARQVGVLYDRIRIMQIEIKPQL